MQNYNYPKLSLIIPNGSSASSNFKIQDVDKAALVAPDTLTGTTTLQYSIDSGSSWRDTSATVEAGGLIDSATLASYCGLFHKSVLWRLNNSGNVSADREFLLFGIK